MREGVRTKMNMVYTIYLGRNLLLFLGDPPNTWFLSFWLSFQNTEKRLPQRKTHPNEESPRILSGGRGQGPTLVSLL